MERQSMNFTTPSALALSWLVWQQLFFAKNKFTLCFDKCWEQPPSFQPDEEMCCCSASNCRFFVHAAVFFVIQWLAGKQQKNGFHAWRKMTCVCTTSKDLLVPGGLRMHLAAFLLHARLLLTTSCHSAQEESPARGLLWVCLLHSQ